MKPLCIFHSGCDDGFGAAWAVNHANPGLFDFHPGDYKLPPPDVSGRNVLLVDFSYKRAVLSEMARTAHSITVIDHHKSAAKDLAGLLTPMEAGARGESISAIFDMKRSGAGMAWDHFHPKQPRPAFINYIEDRDLWTKRLSGGDEFTIALRSYPQDFETWDRLVAAGPEPLIAEGVSLQRYYRRRVEDAKKCAYRSSIRDADGLGHSIMIANAPYFLASEVAGELAHENDVDFGAVYHEEAQGEWKYSLRSRGDFDVSVIAEHFGGGGHPPAAGFTTHEIVHA